MTREVIDKDQWIIKPSIQFKPPILPPQNRAYELHRGDVLYCNTEWLKENGYYYELTLGEVIHIHQKPNSILNDGVEFRVVYAFKEKKYPNKKWWQFCIKQEEEVTGYHLEVV